MIPRAASSVAVAPGRRRRPVLGALGRRGLRAVLAVAALSCGVLATAQPAAAEEQPSIVKAYGLDWIQHVREEAWPDPKERRPVICLLDTGVAVTPDTPEDNPLGPIVARLALDGGTGLPQGDTWVHRHGTDMASVIAAPRNDYGTVGVFPQARIVSVRVTEGDETYIHPSDMELGVRACRQWSLDHGNHRVAVVVMAESGYDQRPADAAQWERSAQLATGMGAVFVAAAGNSAGAQLVPPLAIRDLVSVLAGADDGGLCWFAQAAPIAGLRGPGCTTSQKAGEAQWPAGSSAATAAVGALAAAVSTRDPSLTPSDRRRQLFDASTSVDADGGRRVDGSKVRHLFAGFDPEAPAAPSLDGIPGADAGGPLAGVSVTRGPQGTASPPAESPAGRPANPPVRAERLVRLWRPSVTARWRSGRLYVRRLDRPAVGSLQVAIYGGSGRPVVRTLRGNSGTYKTARVPKRVEAWAVGGTSVEWRSLSRRAKVVR